MALHVAALVLGMGMLAYASVPLYRMFCQVTGYGGTTQRSDTLPEQVLSQDVIVRFNTDMDAKLPWQFEAGDTAVTLPIGKQGITYFTAKNLSDTPVTGRAIYNVVPHEAGPYFNKIECFCFINQTLQPGEEMHMPVVFFVDPAIVEEPELKNIETITLSYTFFKAKEGT